MITGGIGVATALRSNSPSSGGANAGLLATRRDGEILIAEEPTRVELRWTNLASSDGDEIEIVWSASLCCVDSAADRAMLAERYLSNANSLAATRAAVDLTAAMASSVRAEVATHAADALIDGSTNDALSIAIENAGRSAAFAAGLTLLPPFELHVSSPSRERARRAEASRDRLAALAEQDAIRAKSLADLSRALIDSAGDPARAGRLVAGVRLADPLDLLRVTAIVEPSWSAPTPALWIAAGTKIARVDVADAAPELELALTLDGELGPVRSMNAASIDGADVLLIGARDGVYVAALGERLQITKQFRHPTGSEFGFNAVAFLEADRRLVATHSQAGIVSWSIDEPSSPPVVEAMEKSRGVIALDRRRAALLVDGKLAAYTPGVGIEFVDGTREFVAETEIRGVRRRKVLREELAGSAGARYVPATAAEDELDVAGVPRIVRPLAAGGLELADLHGATRLEIGPSSLVARSVAVRPGFVAAIGADRMNVSLIDLARPDAVHAQWNVSIALGSRVADVCTA